MNREQACNYLRSSGFSEEQIKAIEGAFTCDDAISALNRVMEYTYGMLTAEKAGLQHLIKSMLDDLPPINPQKPCEPVRNPDQLDCISRQAAIDTIESWLSCDDYYNEAERHIMRAVQSVLYDLPPVNPQKPVDPAYEKMLNKWIGAEVLDRIRNEMHATAEKHEDGVYYLRDEWVDEIIDRYAEEGKA